MQEYSKTDDTVHEGYYPISARFGGPEGKNPLILSLLPPYFPDKAASSTPAALLTLFIFTAPSPHKPVAQSDRTPLIGSDIGPAHCSPTMLPHPTPHREPVERTRQHHPNIIHYLWLLNGHDTIGRLQSLRIRLLHPPLLSDPHDLPSYRYQSSGRRLKKPIRPGSGR